MTREPLPIVLDGVRFSYGGVDSETYNFSARFAPGRITAVLGPSGAGKSTLLNLIAGFERPLCGRIFAGDVDIAAWSPAERPISMIFQANNLFAHLTAAQNVGLGINPDLRLSPADHTRIAEALAAVDLSALAQRRPGMLSGGERQRVAIARMLVRDKPALLMDEALASLGPGLRRQLLTLIGKFQREKALTVVMITHSPEDALQIADDAVFVDDRQVLAQGPASVLLEKADHPAIQSYLGSTISDGG
ncbi:MAG: ATP-binding cassette domain-containing protein [Pseudomonadota bacterium]